MEYVTTSSFLHPPPLNSLISRKAAKTPPITAPPSAAHQQQISVAEDTLIPVWFTNFFNTAAWSVVGLNSITTYSALANVLLFPAGLGSSRRFFVAGLVAAVGHYAFVPGVMASVEALIKMCDAGERGVEKKNGGSAVKELREWVGVHRVRMCTVDVAAWLCFLVGVVGVLS